MRRLDPQQAGLFEGEMGLLLKNSPQSINAEPCHMVIEGMGDRWDAVTKVPRGRPSKPNTGADWTERRPNSVQAARQLGSKRVSVAMSLQLIVLPSHMACEQVPT